MLIIVGGAAKGQLDVTNGGSVTARQITIGESGVRTNPDNSLVLIDFGGGEFGYRIFGYYSAGTDLAGYGTLNVTGGSTVTLTATSNVPWGS